MAIDAPARVGFKIGSVIIEGLFVEKEEERKKNCFFFLPPLSRLWAKLVAIFFPSVFFVSGSTRGHSRSRLFLSLSLSLSFSHSLANACYKKISLSLFSLLKTHTLIKHHQTTGTTVSRSICCTNSIASSTVGFSTISSATHVGMPSSTAVTFSPTATSGRA